MEGRAGCHTNSVPSSVRVDTKDYQVRTEYGHLKVENLFTGSPSIITALQKVSVLTVNGRLGMTLVSSNVFPTLLEDAREILARV
jgi:hypothetical protein